jgi:hypothetical protein
MNTLSTVALLTLSNVFMTFAWYGHLKFKESPLWIAILASWGIAFFEYCVQVPANRIGAATLDVYQLKILQEAITLSVFIGFAVFYFSEAPKMKHLVSMALITLAVAVAFRK